MQFKSVSIGSDFGAFLIRHVDVWCALSKTTVISTARLR